MDARQYAPPVADLWPRCPCDRPHGILYSDGACDAARRRQAVVHQASLDTSAAISLRIHRLSTDQSTGS